MVRAQVLSGARAELRQVVERIRTYIPEFLALAQFKDIVQAAQQTDLIYLATTEAGGIAIRVSSDGDTVDIKHVSLPQLVEGQLRLKLNRFWAALHAWQHVPSIFELQQQAMNALDELLRWVWDGAMKYLAGGESKRRGTMLVPVGLLGFLPLQAAWTADMSSPTGRLYALDAGLISYTPSAKMLTRARSRMDVAVDSFLGVAEPRPSIAPPLPNASYEVGTATSYFEPTRITWLQHEQARHEDVMEACLNHAVLHFSCHGYANFQKPLESGLLMSDNELLTVRDFLGIRLSRGRLAVLSSCETGLPGVEAPNEMIGLPTGLLQAGVAGVVGSMWRVNDVSTMMLMTRFYELWRKGDHEPAAALRAAQLWVRDTTNKEKAGYFSELISQRRISCSRILNATAERLFQDMVLEEPEQRSFSHPYYWSGFSYFGA
jgi:CHAT domain-containing protein